MPYMNVDPSTGFLEFTRTPEEKETIDLKERVKNLEKLLETLVKDNSEINKEGDLIDKES